MAERIKKEEEPPQTFERSLCIAPTIYRPYFFGLSGFPTMSFPRQNSIALQPGTPVASVVAPALFSDNQQLRTLPAPELALNSLHSELDTLRISLRQVDEEFDEFDPAKFEPADFSFDEAYRALATGNLDKNRKFLRKTILRYSLCIRGFPDGPKENLNMAVYFYFQEKFEIKAEFKLCVRFDYGDAKNLVGVIFCSLKARDEIYAKANACKSSKIKITSCEEFFWIPEIFYGPGNS